eukprot:319095-Prymnesium_polylepis.1
MIASSPAVSHSSAVPRSPSSVPRSSPRHADVMQAIWRRDGIQVEAPSSGSAKGGGARRRCDYQAKWAALGAAHVGGASARKPNLPAAGSAGSLSGESSLSV